MEKLINDCQSLSLGIAKFIADWISSKLDFECRSFYGETFALTLLSRHGLLTEEIKTKLLRAYTNKDKSDPEFHHEFNNYALNDYASMTSDQSVLSLFHPLKFKGTPCTNWTLLRTVVLFKEKEGNAETLKEIDKLLERNQLSSGLILDDAGVRSFQYHCFSSALLYELFEITGEEKYKKRFLDAAQFIRHFILPNGDTLYIGRGQEQSFGMGVLVYILACAYNLSANSSYLGDIKTVLKFLNAHKRPDGSFPLMLNRLEKKIPTVVDMTSEELAGWYPYNNYFDYLPFMALFLDKSARVLASAQPAEEIVTDPQTSYGDKFFIKIVRTRYIAVLSLPGGYWTNDLPFPLIYFKDNFLTPMLGGEQFQPSLYGEDMLSFPVTAKKRWPWRKYGKGFWLNNKLVWISLFGLYIRDFNFLEDKIIIKNKFYSWVDSMELYAFKDSTKEKDEKTLLDKKFILRSDRPVTFFKKGLSASGRLNIFQIKGGSTITLELL